MDPLFYFQTCLYHPNNHKHYKNLFSCIFTSLNAVMFAWVRRRNTTGTIYLFVCSSGLKKTDLLKKTLSLKKILLSYGLDTLEENKWFPFMLVHYLSLYSHPGVPLFLCNCLWMKVHSLCWCSLDISLSTSSVVWVVSVQSISYEKEHPFSTGN